ncbi:MAG: hypothetical protein Q9195_009291 [Heterodermia aff. obscurata]
MATEELGTYQVLAEPQAVSRKTKILGCVIPSQNNTNPFDDYVPYLENPKWKNEEPAGEELRKALENFWKPNQREGGEDVELKDILVSSEGGNATEGRLKLTEALQGHIKRKSKKNCRIEAGSVNVYTIDNPGGAVRTILNKCTPWMSELQVFHDSDQRKKPTYYIVTGVYTCSNVKVSYYNEQSSGAGGEAKLPGDAVVAGASQGAALPGAGQALDISTEIEHSRKKEEEQHTTIDGEIIFALRYHILDVEFESPEEKGSWLNRRLRHFVGSTGKKTAIKKVKLGKPVRDPHYLKVLSDDSNELFYFKEPVYAVPDDGIDAHEHDGLSNGVAH